MSEESSGCIARYGDGEQVIANAKALERSLKAVVESGNPELWLIPSLPGRRIGSIAMRVFGLMPRPSIVVHFGPAGALVTFRDPNGGDYRAVNREFKGEAIRGELLLFDGRRVDHRADEVFERETALGFVRDYFREGVRPWRLSVRPVQL